MLIHLLLALRLTGIVDRVEGAWVIVEWPNGQFDDLPITVFNREPQEGEVFRLRIRSSPVGPDLALPGPVPRLSTTAGLLYLPEHVRLRPGHRYAFCIRLPQEAECRPPVNPSPKGPEPWQKLEPRNPPPTPEPARSKGPSFTSSVSTEKEP